MLPRPKSESKLEAKIDPFSSDTGRHCRDPGPISDGATTLTQTRNSKERDVSGERDRWGKEQWNVQFLPKEREGNSKGIQEMSSP